MLSHGWVRIDVAAIQSPADSELSWVIPLFLGSTLPLQEM